MPAAAAKIVISIHVPLARDDIVIDERAAIVKISIHVPLARDDNHAFFFV